MRYGIRRLDRTLFDAGGPIMLVLLIGVPILLVVLIIAMIALAVYLIRKARHGNGGTGEPPPAE